LRNTGEKGGREREIETHKKERVAEREGGKERVSE